MGQPASSDSDKSFEAVPQIITFKMRGPANKVAAWSTINDSSSKGGGGGSENNPQESDDGNVLLASATTTSLNKVN